MVIEEVIINYLKDQMSVPVYLQRPESNPNPGRLSFLVVQKVGGTRSNYLRHATIALQAYADTHLTAARLIEEAIEKMDGITVLNEISQADLETGPYAFPLTATKQPRYQAVYAITHY